MQRWWRKKYRLPTTSHAFTDVPLAVWEQELVDDLLVERDGLRQDLRDLGHMPATKEGKANVAAQQAAILKRLNALNDVLEFPQDVLDAAAEHDKQMLAKGVKPTSIERIERLLRAQSEG